MVVIPFFCFIRETPFLVNEGKRKAIIVTAISTDFEIGSYCQRYFVAVSAASMDCFWAMP